MTTKQGGAIVAAVIGAIATIVAALVHAGGGGGNQSNPAPGDRASVTAPAIPQVALPSFTLPELAAPPHVFLNRDSGPGGATVLVSGEGFSHGERVVIRFSTEQIGATTASGQGGFANVAVTIPRSFSVFAPQQFEIDANGEVSIKTASAPFTITG